MFPGDACCGNITRSVPPTRVERVAGQFHWLAIIEHRLPCLGALRNERKERKEAQHRTSVHMCASTNKDVRCT